jgi:hypothetical protein
MSDFDRIPERPAESPAVSFFAPMNVETLADHNRVAPPLVAWPAGGQHGRPLEAAHTSPDLDSLLRHDLESHERVVDGRVVQLVSEIVTLAAEARLARGPRDRPLIGIRCYCQGVVNSIGAFFMAVADDGELDLSCKEGHLAEVARMVGLYSRDLKALRETRCAYKELEYRLRVLENCATPKQQRDLFNTTEDLQIHGHTRELFQSLLHSRRNLHHADAMSPGQESL